MRSICTRLKKDGTTLRVGLLTAQEHHPPLSHLLHATSLSSLPHTELKSSAQRPSFLGDYADGARLRERCHINLSMMTLSTVIRKLRRRSVCCEAVILAVNNCRCTRNVVVLLGYNLVYQYTTPIEVTIGGNRIFSLCTSVIELRESNGSSDTSSSDSSSNWGLSSGEGEEDGKAAEPISVLSSDSDAVGDLSFLEVHPATEHFFEHSFNQGGSFDFSWEEEEVGTAPKARALGKQKAIEDEPMNIRLSSGEGEEDGKVKAREEAAEPISVLSSNSDAVGDLSFLEVHPAAEHFFEHSFNQGGSFDFSWEEEEVGTAPKARALGKQKAIEDEPMKHPTDIVPVLSSPASDQSNVLPSQQVGKRRRRQPIEGTSRQKRGTGAGSMSGTPDF
ncbi:hypothetical protein Acr_22g0003470 [Actinidia rufa]|uniref:Uncharacterized protein n=1 Tax=Actinidia rufa TaxID=165716 RepID=A0A7J0GJG2_9ERIC|nr:hypothetical protein Acr_22g0003470 [Actinidia rufa]